MATAAAPRGAATATTKAAAHPSGLAFARCMRAHGLGDFPDPDSTGVIDLKALHPGPGSDLDPADARFQAAQRACKPLQPATFVPGAGPASAAGSRRAEAHALAFARCMRAHGVPSFPDPDSSGRLSVHAIHAAGIGSASPALQSGLKACATLRPGNIHVAQPGGGP